MLSEAAPSELPLATQLCVEAAEGLGYAVEILDPEFGYLFELRGPGGARRRMLGGRSPLNDAVAARLAEDKHYTGLLLERAGLRTPRTTRCLSPRGPSLTAYRDRAGAAPGEALAAEIGFPVVVKPNRLSHGRGVRLADEATLREAIEAAWDLDAIALVQERMRGRDVRLDFVDGELIAGYERRPLEVRGDGTSTLADLAAAFDARFADRALLLKDARLTAQLGERTLDWVVPAGERFGVGTTILNLNGAASGVYIDRVDPELRTRCRSAGAALGLRHFGVDLKLADGEEPAFLEVNASPLLLQLYRLGWREQALAAQRRVLRAIFEGA